MTFTLFDLSSKMKKQVATAYKTSSLIFCLVVAPLGLVQTMTKPSNNSDLYDTAIFTLELFFITQGLLYLLPNNPISIMLDRLAEEMEKQIMNRNNFPFTFIQRILANETPHDLLATVTSPHQVSSLQNKRNRLHAA